MRRELLEVKVREILGENPVEILEFEMEDSRNTIILTSSYELTFRCNKWERCEVMLRYADSPAVFCTTRCYEDPASALNGRLLEELKAKVEALIRALGVKLLDEGDLG